jgi:hypothetical protein
MLRRSAMTSDTQSILSPSLTAKLSTLGRTLGRERSDREIGDILAELSTLPAIQIVPPVKFPGLPASAGGSSLRCWMSC